MGRKKQVRTFMCDFETTVYKGQEYTEVWASASVELYTEDVRIDHSIGETLDYFISLNTNIIAYYHNLKFDGHFWLDYLINNGYTQAYYEIDDNHNVKWDKSNEMPSNSFRYSISDMGQWYTITIKLPQHKTIEIRDSLKLLPFSVKRIGKAFKTKHQKLDMEYEGFRYAGCNITDEEREYIANDVLVVKEALEVMFSQGHTKTTIGSNCLEEFKSTFWSKKDYYKTFPNLYEFSIDKDTYGSDTVGDYIHRSYKGGWCYLVKGKAEKLLTGGTTADVNSLYPSMMSSESGNIYPTGTPTFWKGDFIPSEATESGRYFFVRVKTRFRLKSLHLPCIQIKRNPFYKSTEWLATSDFYLAKQDMYVPSLKWQDGRIEEARPTLTLTMTDYYLIKEHYDLYDFEILDGCWFYAQAGIFDDYIEKYKKIKLESKGALRELAKLFLNNLYGKMASSTDSSFKVATLDDNGVLTFRTVFENDKTPGYIAVGSAITSYARNFTIRAAQKNFYGADKRGFVYADTDSIHCDLPADQIKGITVHDRNFCCWKLESSWDRGWFIRQKTYMEHVTHENLEPLPKDEIHWDIKCAGMPDNCKKLFRESMEGGVLTEQEKEKLTVEQKEFLKEHRTVGDFTYGLKVPGKLIPRRIKGGILLVEDYYTLRG